MVDGDTHDDGSDGGELALGDGRSWPLLLIAVVVTVLVVGSLVAATRPDRSSSDAASGAEALRSYAVARAGEGVGVGRGSADQPPPPACHPAPGSGTFRLAFFDDFDGDEGPDPAWWWLYDSPGNAGNGLRRPAAVATAGGLLTITAQMVDGALVSGGMANQLGQTYGRWEFRVRTDPDPSGATSGVVLTWPVSGRWPIDGESDIYETGEIPSRRPFFSFIHYGADNDQEAISHDADGTAWHDMAMDWTPDRIAVYRDGVLAGQITKREAIPHVAHELTIQLDAWRPTMGDTPVTMQVDWVRVYRWERGGGC